METYVKKAKKITTAIVLAAVLFVQVGYAGFVSAQEAPSSPSAPTTSVEASQSSSQTTTVVQEAPTQPTAPEAPSSPNRDEESHTSPSLEEVQTGESSPEEGSTQQGNVSQDETANPSTESTVASSGTQASSASPSTTTTNNNEGVEANGQVGDTSIDTGDGLTSGVISTSANTNVSASSSVGENGDISVVNADNGTDSDNSGSVSVVDTTSTTQDNRAKVGNDLEGETITGENSASRNVGNASITTGEANTSGTLITSLNTNIDGVSVSEFNVLDDQMGDIVLDFGANCISGCGGVGSVLAKNSGNGADSQNSSEVDQISNDATFQNNDATVGNDLRLVSDSGNNTASENTNGDSTIETGDANVSANVLTFANNNLSGNVMFGVVNVYGDLVGDIILPEEVFNTCLTCAVNTTAANTGNGSSSTNDASVSQATHNVTQQTNDATIENNLLLDANTGDNSASGNTEGDTAITTGDATIEAQTLNVANSNIEGGNWWLVLVNEAGQWIGKIVGQPDGASFAGSAGTEFVVNENGEITAVNSGNGSTSQNTSDVSTTTNNTTVQTNTANIQNSLNLSANTGENKANDNTGGDTTIQTGDARIVANLVNFVNNNITGGGKLVVTVVNVFGSWFGDFVSPGQKKESKELASNPDSPSAPSNQPSEAPHVGGPSADVQSVSSPSDPSSSNGQVEETTEPIEPTPKPSSNGFFAASVSNSAVQGVSESRQSVDPSEKQDAPFSLEQGMAAKKKVKINLAWLFFLGGLGGVAVIGKKFLPLLLARLKR